MDPAKFSITYPAKFSITYREKTYYYSTLENLTLEELKKLRTTIDTDLEASLGPDNNPFINVRNYDQIVVSMIFRNTVSIAIIEKTIALKS
jgi:hypothetical protein